MSAKKGFETKIREDENTDSGFLSGPISQDQDDYDRAEAEAEEARPSDKPEQKDDKVKSVSDEIVDLDSGLDLCLSGCLEGLSVSEQTVPALTVTEEGADIPPLAILFQQDDDGDTQLHIAAVHGCEKSVGTLIRVCPAKYLLDLPNDYAHTPLHLAVMSGHAVITRMLVRAGAAVGLRDLKGDTPLHLATAAKNVECLQALLAPVEGQSTRRLASVLNQKNYAGQTCVHIAANLGHRQTIQTLVYYGADINAREGLAGWTALHIAARRGDVRLAQALLQVAGIAVRARDYAGRTPRRLARKLHRRDAEHVNRLLAALPADSDDSESDSEDEYDSDSENVEDLFDRLRGNMTVASLVTN